MADTGKESTDSISDEKFKEILYGLMSIEMTLYLHVSKGLGVVPIEVERGRFFRAGFIPQSTDLAQEREITNLFMSRWRRRKGEIG